MALEQRMSAPTSIENLERREPKMTAALVRLHLQVMRERYGAAVDQAVEDLDAEERAELTALLPVQWVKISTLIDFYEAAARRLSRPIEELHWEVGRECVDRTFKTMWRLLLRVTTDEALVARAPVIHTKTYSVGRLEAHVTAPGRARIALSEWPNTPTFVRRGLCIGITTVLSLASRRDVVVRDEWHRDGAIFTVTWRP